MQTVGVYRIKGNDSCVLKHRCSHFHNSQLQTGKGNKTLFRIFKHGRLFWVMGERLSERHAMMNRWYVSVLVSEQTRSEEDYGRINLCWRKKKWKEFVKLLCAVNGFSSEGSAVPNETVGGKRGKRCLSDTWDVYRSSIPCQLKLTSKAVPVSPRIPICLSLEVQELGCKSICLQVKNSNYLSCQGHTDLSVYVFVQFSDEWNYFQRKKVGQWKCRLRKAINRRDSRAPKISFVKVFRNGKCLYWLGFWKRWSGSIKTPANCCSCPVVFSLC